MYISALLFSPLLVLTAQACSDISYDLERRAEVGGAMEWGYGPENGPLSWYTMNTTANALCGTGKHQTPIDLSEHTARIDSPRPYQLNYSILKDVTLYRTHHTVQVNVAATNTLNTLTFNGKVYNLLQFHFHVPSEHHIDEEYYPMEVHFVHKSAGKDTLLE
jgi:carbonic anhydrase